ncbi:response regulator [uncultured Desulfobacter sp.]|uniref:response regulator n=1 Tax=uncultured Desulfobacter sp. TaxID=240139 RepID=UPI002AAAF87B|nr:response regulator [uncultured Desulfobacter sp.]
MMTDKHRSLGLSSVLTAIVLSLSGLGLYAKTLALIAPSIAAACLIWAVYHLLRPQSMLQKRSLVLIFTAYMAWFACLSGGIFSPGLFFLIIAMAGSVLFADLFGLFITGGLGAALIAFFYFGPSWGPGVLNPNEFRLAFFVILFFGIGSILFMMVKNQQALVSERQAAVEYGKKVQEEAQNAIQVKDRFLANLSHEIRNPMNGVLGMIHVLLDSELDAEQRHHADIAYNRAKALLTIVNDILDLSKIDAGKIELDIRPFDLEIAVKDIVSLPEVQARQKGLEFSYNIDTDVPRLLKGDISRIRQVILNLTGNAIKFTESGSVTLNVTLKEDREDHALVHFSVDDTGIGISEDVLKGLFSPFAQADVSITKKYGGTGLGLSISKLFIELMGGRVDADSIEMIGSTFWFEVPFEKQQPEEIAQDLSAIPMNKIRVIATSDEPEPSLQLTKALDRMGGIYKTCEHRQVLDLVRLASSSADPFHVVIMEVSESDQYARTLGMEFSRDPELHTLARVIVSAVGKKGDARVFEDLGFSAFLSYPLDGIILTDALRTVLSPNYQKDSMAIITRYALAERKKRAFKILIVDDVETNVMTVKAIIGKQGYQADSALNGIQAVAMVKNNKYDLIFMDCQMPEMDGYEAARLIREHESKEHLSPTPIIAMTGNAFDRDWQTCKEAGMNDYISKPVNPQGLVELIDTYKSAAGDFMVHDTHSYEVPDPNITDLDPGLDPCGVDPQDPMPDTMGDKNPVDEPVFDRAGFLERFGNDEELAADVLESFAQEVEELVDNLVAAVGNEPFDPEYVIACAHALKGGAANVNAEQLRLAALDIEIQVKNGVQLETSAINEMFKEYLNRFIGKALL